MQKYKFGESAIMPEGRPYMFSIEGTDAVYALTHTIDDAGRIHMAVDRADQASVTDCRRAVTLQDSRQQRSNPTFQVLDEDDADAYNARGLLKNGFGIRVKMNAMDAAPNNGMQGSGTPDDPYILGSPPSRKQRRTVERDPMGREAATFTEGDASQHKPGSRFGDAAGMAAKDAAYAEMVTDLQTAWMSPEQRAQNISDARRVTADAKPPEGVTAGDWARHQRMIEDSNAWRGDGTTEAAGPAQVEGAQSPRGILPVGALKPSPTLCAGMPCSQDGASGVLVERNGLLYCETKPMTATRADAVGTRDAQDQAYAEYVRDISNAWRTPA
jgi:hypothetical protein